MYVREAVADLENTLAAVSSDTTCVYIAHGRNCTAEDSFLELCAARWTVQQVGDNELHTRYQAEDVTVWRMRRK